MFMGRDNTHGNKDQIIAGVVRQKKIIQGNGVESMGVGGEELPARAEVWGQEQAWWVQESEVKG